MMKKSLLFILILFSVLSRGQQHEEVALNWGNLSKVTVGAEDFTVPQFDSRYMDFNASQQLLYFRYGFAATGPLNENSLQLTNIVYENITAADLGSLNRRLMPSDLKATLKAVNARGQWSATLQLNPIVKEGNAYKRIKSFTFSYSPGVSTGRSAAATTAITNSVLSSGSWHRFYVQKSGVYKLTRAFLSSLGFDANVDPRTIKIYGNGGRMAPMLNSTAYPMDLAENAVKFVGQEDGKFDSSDYILFYAEGVDNWNAESLTNNNLFSDRSYYYVTAGAGNGKRIQTLVQPTATPSITTSVFDDYQYHELDEVNIARLGRKWHGEAFNIDNEQTFDFTVPDHADTPVKLKVSVAAKSVGGSSMDIAANGATVGSINLSAVSSSLELGYDGYYSGTFTAAGNSIKIKLTYNNGGIPAAEAWLDYIILEAQRTLKGTSKQYRFRLNAAQAALGPVVYNFTTAGSIDEIWDITDIYNAASVTNDSGATFSFTGEGGELRQYITVVPSDYYTPLREGTARVANQNLKGTIFQNSQGQFQDIDYLIVTPKFLNASAESLAAIHRSREGLNVKVVNLENIYEEFSSGKQDIGAIRNFVKYVYNNASSTDKRVKYLNLFGEASFDYKDRIPNNTNIVPVVHGISLANSGAENYSLTNTFVTDDFYGVMDDDEGTMTTSANYGLDIATGRMLVTTVADANEMVNKVTEYLSEESYGRWRNEYIMIADDEDANTDTFVDPLQSIAATIAQYKNFINMRKVYIDSYVQQASSGGERYPEAKEQILRYINFGALVVNYLGHGGEGGMASERIFESSDAAALTNQYKYPLFITTTCELTKFDNPYLESVGEYVYKNPSGGAIAMITTTRAIYISAAKDLNTLLSGYLYAYSPTNTYDYPTMAEAFRRTKASALANINPQFKTCASFIGDPALHLAIPKINIVLTKINDVAVAQSTEVLKSLAYVKLSGQVTDESGTVLNGYNGEVQATVFDKETARTTLVNDGVGAAIPFSTLGEAIFRGNATVTNGQFNFGFVVPRDIRVPVGNGRVSFYAKKTGVLEDQTGYDTAIQVGGVNANAEADNTPPTVKLYMNDETFVSGGITNDSPILLAYLEDAHGINTSSGIGHDILGILDGNETSPFLMNDYYEADANDYTHGTVRYPFVNLEKGLHTLTFKAWDVYNNLVTAEIQFVVAGTDELKLEKVLNYPNPFVSYTEFWFNHNRPFEPLDVQVQIFTVTGKIVRTINQQVTTDGFLSRDVKWDGRDDFGDKIGKGVYIYKLTVRSSSTNKKAEKFEKLVLL